MRSELVAAITARNVVSFSYEGNLRIGEPHKLGKQDGKLILEMYQTRGTTQSGGLPDWRAFRVDRIRSLTVLLETFTPRTDFNPKRRQWDSTVAEV